MEQRLPATPRAIPEARSWIRGAAAAAGFSTDDQETLALVVSEAVTNAVLHSGSTPDDELTVRLSVDAEGWWLDVIDHGEFVDRAEPREFGGHGLAIIEHLSRGYTLQHGPTGTHLRVHVFDEAATVHGPGVMPEHA